MKGEELKKEVNKIAEEQRIRKLPDFSILDNEEIYYNNLNLGEFKDCWYFGKIFKYLTNKKEEEREGVIKSNRGKILINKRATKIIKGRIKSVGENEINQWGLNYKHNLEINKNFWSNKSIKNWFLAKEKIDKNKFYEKVKNKISYYMDVQDEKIFSVVTCWIIGTYCYELFESYGYLYFSGMRESGKSKFKKILRLLGFNAQEASSISEASFFRTIENTKGVLCIDEYERMDTDRKKATDLLLNAGIEKGASVKRFDSDLKRNRDFDVFCPKIICNITGLSPVTQSRTIPIRLSRTTSDKGKRKPKTNDSEWQDLRDGCYELVMDYWQEIKKEYNDYKTKLNNRVEDVWLPVLVMAKFFNCEKEVLEFAEKNAEESQLEDIENDTTYNILKNLLEFNKIREEIINFHVNDLADYLKCCMNYGDKNPERVIGWHLTNLNVFKKSRDGAGITYELNKEKLLLAMLSRNFPIPEKYKKDVEKLHNTTYYTNTTINTETTQNNVVNVVNVAKNKGGNGIPFTTQDLEQAAPEFKEHIFSQSKIKEIQDQAAKEAGGKICPAKK